MKHRSYKVYHTLMKLNSPFDDCITLPNRGMPVGITSIIAARGEMLPIFLLKAKIGQVHGILRVAELQERFHRNMPSFTKDEVDVWLLTFPSENILVEVLPRAFHETLELCGVLDGPSGDFSQHLRVPLVDSPQLDYSATRRM